MPCFKRNWFRADLREMARSCSNLQQADKLHKCAENSTIKVFYWGWVRVQAKRAPVSALSALKEMKYMINTKANFAIQPIFAM